MRFLFTSFVVFTFLAPSSAPAFNQEDAADQWTRAYVWLQTGRTLADSGQMPLALGNYIEALHGFEALATEYPDFETKMVTFRLKALRQKVTDLKTGLSAEDLAISKRYFDFIQLLKLADNQRFEARRDEASKTLRKAKAELDAIVALRPEGFKTALDGQDRRLSGDIAWLDKLAAKTASGVVHVSPKGTPSWFAKGTTEFISKEDLPGQPENQLAGGSLFPGR